MHNLKPLSTKSLSLPKKNIPFYSIIAIFLMMISTLHSDEFRKWTDVESGRQIEGIIKDKKSDDSEALILLKSGKTVWLKSGRLAEDDKIYIKNWIKSVKHLTCRIVGYAKGSKRIKVVAVSGSREMRVVACKYVGEKEPLTKNLKANEEIEFEYEASNEYVIKAWSGKELVDEESWKKKTEL